MRNYTHFLPISLNKLEKERHRQSQQDVDGSKYAVCRITIEEADRNFHYDTASYTVKTEEKDCNYFPNAPKIA